MQTTIDGLKINYSDVGEGDLVLLLHGWGSNIGLFASMTEVLKKKYRVIAPDMPGFGLSQEPEKAWTVDDYVDFILKFLEPFNPKKLIVLGHSFGGRVIFKMNSRKLPFEITKAILIDVAGIKPEKSLKRKIIEPIYSLGEKILRLRPVKALFPDLLEDLKKSHGSEDYRSATPVMRETLVNTVNEDLKDLMPNMKMPVLLIWGELDTATPLSDAKYMENVIPDAGLVTVKGAGHYSFLENQPLVNNVLASFLEIK